MIRAEQLWLAVDPFDMRLGIDGLSLKVQEALGRSPGDGSAYAPRFSKANGDASGKTMGPLSASHAVARVHEERNHDESLLPA
jgi:hypothetical protein